MDVESRNFKAYQQVPKWWSILMTAGVISALVVAIIALAVGSAAMREANDNSDENVVFIDDDEEEVTPRNTQVATDDDDDGERTTEGTNEGTSDDDDGRVSTLSEGDEMDSDRVLPGNENYTGFTHVPRPRTGRYLDIVTHGHVSNSNFALLQKGIDDAAQLFGVDVSYMGAENAGEPVEHTEIIQYILNARRSLKSGLAVSFMEHTPELGQALNEAAVDLPVLSMLLDEDAYENLEIDTFGNLGFSNRLAGREAGQRFGVLGVQSPLCLLSGENIFGQDDACESFLEQVGAGLDIQINSDDTGSVDTNLADAVTENNADGILAIDSNTFEAAYAYLEENDLLCSFDTPANESDCIVLAAFGENERILNGIADGSVAFALDNQQYLQGYLAVLFLFLRSNFQLEPGSGRSVVTGPVMIDFEEAERRQRRDIMASQTIQDKTPEDLDIRFIVHGKTSDPFWRMVKNGIRFAARETGVGIDFRHPDSDAVSMEATIESMVQMINEAADDNVDALILSIPRNEPALRDAVSEFSVQTGNPVITINAGHRWFQDWQIQAHIGMADIAEGRDVAERLSEANVRRKVLCVIPERGNEDLEERCQSLQRNDTDLEVIILDSTEDQDFHADMNNRIQVIRDAVVEQLNADGEIQAVVSTGLLATQGCRDALALLDDFCLGNDRPRNNRHVCTEFAAYDVGPEVFTYIKNDEMLFAVDHQPALQGFLPVIFAMIESLYGNRPLLLIATGPRFVDMSNVDHEEAIFGLLAN